jgi:hypothetical protein
MSAMPVFQTCLILLASIGASHAYRDQSTLALWFEETAQCDAISSQCGEFT